MQRLLTLEDYELRAEEDGEPVRFDGQVQHRRQVDTDAARAVVESLGESGRVAEAVEMEGLFAVGVVHVAGAGEPQLAEGVDAVEAVDFAAGGGVDHEGCVGWGAEDEGDR